MAPSINPRRLHDKKRVLKSHYYPANRESPSIFLDKSGRGRYAVGLTSLFRAMLALIFFLHFTD